MTCSNEVNKPLKASKKIFSEISENVFARVKNTCQRVYPQRRAQNHLVDIWIV